MKCEQIEDKMVHDFSYGKYFVITITKVNDTVPNINISFLNENIRFTNVNNQNFETIIMIILSLVKNPKYLQHMVSFCNRKHIPIFP